MNKSTIELSAPTKTEDSQQDGKTAELTLRPKSKGGRNGAERRADNQEDAQSRLILSAIMAFRDGDFSVRLPTDWEGTDGRIAEAFNQTIGLEDRITQEVTRLSATVTVSPSESPFAGSRICMRTSAGVMTSSSAASGKAFRNFEAKRSTASSFRSEPFGVP